MYLRQKQTFVRHVLKKDHFVERKKVGREGLVGLLLYNFDMLIAALARGENSIVRSKKIVNIYLITIEVEQSDWN